MALKALNEATRQQDLSPYIETPLQLVTKETGRTLQMGADRAFGTLRLGMDRANAAVQS